MSIPGSFNLGREKRRREWGRQVNMEATGYSDEYTNKHAALCDNDCTRPKSTVCSHCE